MARRAIGSNVARMIADMDGQGGAVAEAEQGEESLATTDLQALASAPTVVNLVNLIILEAIDARASDIHLEPFERVLKVKYRIDGMLHEMSPPPKKLQAALVSRVKIMAGMNIAERFVAQDGHIHFRAPASKIDIRVATVPTLYGECVVMRLLDRSTGLIDINKLGLSPHCLERLLPMLEKPHGIILVTGPTGSGKTTTRYAGLNHIYAPEKKIITIEDPVEYQLEGVNQIQVNPKRGLTFADGLRAILRQDPDVIMVGEIRDRETADIAIRSALTGHLVFSTLHTNDTPGDRTRHRGARPHAHAGPHPLLVRERMMKRATRHAVAWGLELGGGTARMVRVSRGEGAWRVDDWYTGDGGGRARLGLAGGAGGAASAVGAGDTGA